MCATRCDGPADRSGASVVFSFPALLEDFMVLGRRRDRITAMMLGISRYFVWHRMRSEWPA